MINIQQNKFETHGAQHGEAQVDPSVKLEMFRQWTPHDPRT
jgi:hypothetical protein